MMEHEPKSAHIKKLSYNPGDKRLHVAFRNGSSKTFSGVPADVYEEMTKCNSAGRYFFNVIRQHYKCEDQ